MSSERKAPTDFIKSIYGKPVIVKLHTGAIYKGILNCLDGFMNVVLEQAEEYEYDQFKGRYNDAFIRGNNITYIAPNDDV